MFTSLLFRFNGPLKEKQPDYRLCIFDSPAIFLKTIHCFFSLPHGGLDSIAVIINRSTRASARQLVVSAIRHPAFVDLRYHQDHNFNRPHRRNPREGTEGNEVKIDYMSGLDTGMISS